MSQGHKKKHKLLLQDGGKRLIGKKAVHVKFCLKMIGGKLMLEGTKTQRFRNISLICCANRN